MKNLTSPLNKAKGLGSAKEGSGHWIAQRISAIALIPLIIWFLSSLAKIASGGYIDTTMWLTNPINAVLCILFIIAMFYHGALGMQVIIEDYVTSIRKKYLAIILLKLLCYAAMAIGTFCVLSIYFKG